MRCGRLSALLFTAFVCSAAAVAQTTGDISGRVADGSGANLPGVSLEATSPSLPGVRIAVTDREGLYRIPAVPPGTYRILATLGGFRPAEKMCTVSLGSRMNVDLTLEMAAEERVLVSGDAAPIDTTTTTTGTSYTSEIIGRLPVGRNYADVALANPGATTDFGETQGRYLALSIYGATSADNLWLIDGVNATSVDKGIQGKALIKEFVQEVEIKTGGYQAEYGRALGGIVNVVTKSGGNAFHGGVFVDYDSTATTADMLHTSEDSSTAAMQVFGANRADFGANLGGYFVKDRLWFFGAYNRATSRGHVSRVESSTFVSKDEEFPFDSSGDFYSGKVTWNPATSTSVVATAFSDPLSTSGAGGVDPGVPLTSIFIKPIVSPDPATWNSTRSQGGADFGVRLAQTFAATAVANLQASYHRDRNSVNADEGIQYVDVTCAGGSREKRCNPPAEANSITGGYGTVNTNASTRRQFAADASVFAGAHDIKVGGDYWNGKTDLLTHFTGGQAVQISSEYGEKYYMHRYFAASPTDPGQAAGVRRRAQVLDYGAYVQDSWRAAPGLTIHAGLRWDGETTRDYQGETVFRLTDGWQPRIGVAWDPWRDGRTKVFASAGRFSSILPTMAAAYSFSSVTTYRVFNFDPVSLVQDPGVFGHGRRLGSGADLADQVEEDLKGAYQDELTIGVERALSPSLTLGLKGTYRRLGRALESRCDLDDSSPEVNFSQCAYINPGSSSRFAAGDVPTCNGLFDNPDWYQCSLKGEATPEAKRVYRGIELFATESLGDRLWIQASYVYSSLRGNYDGGVNEGVYSQTLGQTTPGFNYDFDYPQLWHNGYGALTLDRPHRFRLDAFWVTPIRLAVGLQAFAASGAPLNRQGYFNGNLGASVFLDPRGSAGRLPTSWDSNLTLSYPILLGPATVTLEAYLYNLFNNQIVTWVDQGWTTSPPDDFPASIDDPNQQRNNPNYGKVISRSAPRAFRAALRVSF